MVGRTAGSHLAATGSPPESCTPVGLGPSERGCNARDIYLFGQALVANRLWAGIER